MGDRINRLMDMLLRNDKIRPVNGNGITHVFKDREIMRWLLLAGVRRIIHRDGKFYDQFGREIKFYVVNGHYDFRILSRGGLYG